MQDDLATLITSTARRERARDFAWTIAISSGVAIAMIALGGFVADTPVWILSLLALGSFLAALCIRYLFSSGRDWADPVERVVKTELSVNEAELSRLRLVRGVAQALPEPLFILDGDGVIELANPAAEEFLNMDAVEGRHFAAVLRAPDVFEEAQKNYRRRAAPCRGLYNSG